MKTKTIVYGGVFAAIYVVLTLAIAPISYGAIQFRVANLMKPIALLHPAFALSIALGTGMSDLFSPFGVWDWGIMPIVDFVAAILCWKLRQFPVIAILLQSTIVSIGVSVFPLGIAARIPFDATFLPVLIPGVIAPIIGYFLIWHRNDLKQLVNAEIS